MGGRELPGQIVQQAVVTILNQIYEVDFKGFSYGFRPGRNPHQALDALAVGIQGKRVELVARSRGLDAWHRQGRLRRRKRVACSSMLLNMEVRVPVYTLPEAE